MTFIENFVIPVIIESLGFCIIFILGWKPAGKRIIWPRLILISLVNGTLHTLVANSPLAAIHGAWAFIDQFMLFMAIFFASLLMARHWAVEDDDDYRKRKRRRQELLNALKDFKIYGWQPGPQRT